MLSPRYFQIWRGRFLEANQNYDQLGLVRGIFLGDSTSTPPHTVELFRDAGLSHLLAASGYNCWIVAIALMVLLRQILRVISLKLPAHIWLFLRLHADGTAKISGAWLFWLWTDQSPPITRSAIMITVSFFLLLYGEVVKFERILLCLYLLSLAVLPRLWNSASFQLTYGCLFGLFLFPLFIKKILPDLPQNSVVLSIKEYFIASVGACLGTAPVTLALFQQINFNSIFCNWFAVPPVSFVLMPLGLLQMLLLIPLPFGLSIATDGSIIQALAWMNGQTARLIHWGVLGWQHYGPSFVIQTN
jgi:competence protein ComEC